MCIRDRGHTIHETAEEAIAETEQQLNTYASFCEDDLNIPVLKGKKTDSEKFAGAEEMCIRDSCKPGPQARQRGARAAAAMLQPGHLFHTETVNGGFVILLSLIHISL